MNWTHLMFLNNFLGCFKLKSWVLWVLALLLAACGGARPSSENGEKILRLALAEEIQTLDPIYAQSESDIWLSSQIFNTLYTFGEDLVLYPELAEKHQLLPNQREYLISLREDVKFHHSPIFAEDKGRPLRARDVVFSLKRLLKNATKTSEQALLLAQFLAEPLDTAIQEVDHITIKIALKQPVGAFLQLLSMPATAIVPEEAFNSELNQKFAEFPVGTGPFTFGKYKRGSFLILNKNEHYFKASLNDTALPFLDAIDVSFGLDEDDAFAEMRQNGLDLMLISSSSLQKIQKKYSNELQTRYDTLSVPLLSILGARFEVNPMAYKDLKNPMLSQYFRKGLRKGICMDSLGLELPFGAYMETEGRFLSPILPRFSQHTNHLSYRCDLPTSRLLLGKYKPAKDAPNWQFYAAEQHKTLQEHLQNAWKVCQFGLSDNPNQAAIRLEIQRFWVADEALMLSFLAQADTLQSFKDEVGIPWEKVVGIQDAQARQEAATELAVQYNEKSFFIPLYFQRLVLLKQKNVNGIPFTPLGLLKAENIDLQMDKNASHVEDADE